MTWKCKSLLPFKVKLLIYNSLFYSYLYYCLLVWGTTTFVNLHKLLVLQKKFVRLLFNVPYNSHTKNLFQEANIISVLKLYHYKLTTAFRREVKLNRSFLRELCSLELNDKFYVTRHKEIWRVVTPRTNYLREKLSYTMPMLLNKYNNLGVDVTQITAQQLRDLYVQDF